MHDRMKVVALTVIAGNMGPQSATLTLDIDGVEHTVQATGNGPVDAIFNAIKMLVPHDGQARPLSGARRHRGHRRAGRGVGAAGGGRAHGHGPRRRHRHHGGLGEAYVAALNKLLVKRQKTAQAQQL